MLYQKFHFFKNKGEIAMKLFDWIKKKKQTPQPVPQPMPSSAAQAEPASALPKQEQTEPAPAQKPKQHDAAIRLYACRRDISVIGPIFEKAFAEQLQKLDALNSNTFVMTLKDGTFLQIHITSNTQRGMAQIYHIAGLFSNSPLKNAELKEKILQQIKLFNCIVKLKFVLNDDEKRTNAIMQSIYTAAKAITAFVLTPSMELFHYDGRLLIDTEGNSAFETFSPIAASDFLYNNKQPSPSDIARKEKSIAVLKQKKIPYLENLPSAALESDTK